MPETAVLRRHARSRHRHREDDTLMHRTRSTSRSPEALAYHAWYRTAGWRELRRRQLEREPLCRTCARARRSTPATTADHVTPHRGDRALFFNPANLQSLCDIHHTDKQRIENGGKERTPIGADAGPSSAHHRLYREGWGYRRVVPKAGSAIKGGGGGKGLPPKGGGAVDVFLCAMPN
jgi:5-methylcytosine-specific restriction enzyme A